MNIDIKTADGEEIEFGGSYYDGRGTEHRVVGIRLIDYRHITKVSLSCLVGKVENLCCVSMRPNELYSTLPDSWERTWAGSRVVARTARPCALTRGSRVPSASSTAARTAQAPCVPTSNLASAS